MSAQSEQKQGKKGVGFGVVIALVVVIIVLAGGMGYLLYNDNNTINAKIQTITAMNSIIASKNNMTSSLNSTISSLNSQKANLISELNSANQSKASLEAQISSLSNLLYSDNSTIVTLNTQIGSLRNQLSIDNATIVSLNTQIGSLNTQIANLTNQLNYFESITSLSQNNYEVNDYTISQGAGSSDYWTLNMQYAGYIEVIVQSSTTSNTYAYVKWSGYGINYDNSITVGQSGQAYFPVLPNSGVEVGVGNSNLFNGATETVTIIYYY